MPSAIWEKNASTSFLLFNEIRKVCRHEGFVEFAASRLKRSAKGMTGIFVETF